MDLPTVFLVWKCLALIAFGMYTWEIIILLPFDISLLLGRRTFRWPLLTYVICRYSFFATIALLNVFIYATGKIDCKRLYVANGILANIAVGSSSVCLAMRTVAIWHGNKSVLSLLAAIGCIQWGFLIRDVTKRDAHWDDNVMACVVRPIPIKELFYIYIPIMFFDLVVLVLSTIGLRRKGPLLPGLPILVFRQGLVYFVLTFSVHFSLVLTLLVPVDDVITYIFTIVASFVSAVSSCRVVISLEHYADREECRNKKSNQLDNTAEKGVSVACTEQNGRPHGAVFSTVLLNESSYASDLDR